MNALKNVYGNWYWDSIWCFLLAMDLMNDIGMNGCKGSLGQTVRQTEYNSDVCI
jgi:hypothetical protein